MRNAANDRSFFAVVVCCRTIDRIWLVLRIMEDKLSSTRQFQVLDFLTVLVTQVFEKKYF